MRENEIKHEQRAVEADDLGAFYRFVNKRISNRPCVGAIARDDGTILTDSLTMTEQMHLIPIFRLLVSLIMDSFLTVDL